MNNKLLIINDITTYGRVSMFAMYPVLTARGIHPYCLPTAIVSNTLDYGTAEILDTSEWMKKAIEKWRSLGFKFDNISTGLINSEDQVNTIINLIDEHQPRMVIVDPIMADSGEIYPDMYENVVDCNRRLSKKADILLPNYTEATLLANKFVGQTCLKDSQYTELLDALYELGPRAIVIKGCKDSNNRSFNLISESQSQEYRYYYDEQPVSYIGTGDVFSAYFIAELLNGKTIRESAIDSALFVNKVILDNNDNDDPFDLIIEKSLIELFRV